MHVVEGISDRVVALDHGVKITEGRSTQVAKPPGGRRGATSAATPRRWRPRHRGAAVRRRRPFLTMLLQLDNVTTYYGQMRILEGVALAVDAGELVCLLGGNASGKSTTLKTILGIVRPRSGQRA